jgi:hypothetical protein
VLEFPSPRPLTKLTSFCERYGISFCHATAHSFSSAWVVSILDPKYRGANPEKMIVLKH